MRYQRVELPLMLDGLAVARNFFSGCFAEQNLAAETLWVAHLDEAARCVHLTCHGGDACGVDFPIRNIIVDAATHGSTAILLAHNHPSGDPGPSDSDIRATRQLATAAAAVGCEVLDHLVFAGDKCTSLRRLGYL